MTYNNPDAEDALEKVTMKLFATLGWETSNCYHENFGLLSLLGRETPTDVVLKPKLRAALEKLNPGISPLALETAVDELTKDRGTMSPARANQAVYGLLKDGIKVSYRRGGGEH